MTCASVALWIRVCICRVVNQITPLTELLEPDWSEYRGYLRSQKIFGGEVDVVARIASLVGVWVSPPFGVAAQYYPACTFTRCA